MFITLYTKPFPMLDVEACMVTIYSKATLLCCGLMNGLSALSDVRLMVSHPRVMAAGRLE